ncbi:uncharacterized protein N7529_007059 [Penicillium soppii]|uniref:uncharacterized protein n=1 Tax=Penicillium soppii TaxID=69789 RepID=UPI0025489489|nr:uncharacterized protein N7529_007059 [Penicillium soppii]KAJ5865143.1 hypothetical protein N7529_007059 [Penicillium soppii]
MRLFGSPNPPTIPPSPPPSITPVKLDALCDHLAETPGLNIEEMANFLWDEFNISPSSSSIQRGLSRAGYTRKKLSRKPLRAQWRLTSCFLFILSSSMSIDFQHHIPSDKTKCIIFGQWKLNFAL